MRSLEILLLLFAVIAVVQVFAFQHPQPQLGRRVGVALLAVLALIAQVLFESARWQLYPIYAVAVFTLLFAIVRSGAPVTALSRWGGLAVALVLLLIGAGLAWTMPVPSLPRVSPLGTFNHFFRDESRTEAYGPQPGGPRRFVAQFWYPADPAAVAGQAPQPWSPEVGAFGAALAGEAGLPSVFLGHLTLAGSGAYADAPLG
ncbi:MAG: hypothetical protein RLZZ303_2574, partial [Candidatus Hydrogenedentota bacterium]